MKKIISIVLLILLIATTVVISGCLETGCELEYKACTHDCGDGILSGICKEKCTWERRDCIKDN